MVIAPISGRLAGRGDPKAFYMVVQLLQGIGFVLMALARTLPEMLGARGSCWAHGRLLDLRLHHGGTAARRGHAP